MFSGAKTTFDASHVGSVMGTSVRCAEGFSPTDLSMPVASRSQGANASHGAELGPFGLGALGALDAGVAHGVPRQSSQPYRFVYSN